MNASRFLHRLAAATALLLLAASPSFPQDAPVDPCEVLAAEALKALQEADASGAPGPALRGAELLARAMRLCPDNVDYVFQYALAFVIARDEDQARSALVRLDRAVRQALARRGVDEAQAERDPRVLYVGARIHYTFGNNPRMALDLITRLRAREPGFMPVAVEGLEFNCHLGFATQLAFAKEWEEAIRHTRLAEAVARGDARRRDIARRNIAQILRLADRWPESEAAYADLVERYPTDAILRYGYASVLADQYKFDEAAAQWRKVLELREQPGTVDPREADQLQDAPLRYAVTLASRVSPESKREGLERLKAYTQAHPKDARGWYQLGRTYFEGLEDPDNAVECLERARALDPWCKPTLLLLLKIYQVARPDAGRAKALEATLESPSDEEAREREKKRRKKTRADGLDGCE